MAATIGGRVEGRPIEVVGCVHPRFFDEFVDRGLEGRTRSGESHLRQRGDKLAALHHHLGGKHKRIQPGGEIAGLD